MITYRRYIYLNAITFISGAAIVAGLVATNVPPLPLAPVPALVVTSEGAVPIRAEFAPTDGARSLVALTASISGRVTTGRTPASILHQWPGIYAKARFRGSSVIVRFEDTTNRFRITLDDGRSGVLELSRPGAVDLRISGLSPGDHSVRLDKISESPAPMVFGGFFVGTDAEKLPPPAVSSRQIEFVGDSDTVGYGSTALRRDCSDEQVFAATDSSRAFGPRVAAHFGADYRLIARSGIAVVRSGVVMPILYARALPDAADGAPLPEIAADIIVVGLGSNDFGPLKDGEPWPSREALQRDFQAALMSFVGALRRSSPHALLVLVAFGEYGRPLVDAYRATRDSLIRDGAKARLIVLPRLHRRGCHWHLSARDHAFIAERLIAEISAAMPEWRKTIH